MDTVGDPRLPIYGVQRGSQWDGTESGLPTQETDADASAYLNQDVLGDYTSPYAIMKYDEVLFILSEAAFKGLIPGGEAIAQDYYERAVEASIRYWDEVNPSETYQVSDEVINQFIGKVAWNNTYEQIMLQKYVALFWVGYEAWHEYRRTELPELPIGSGTDNDHILPRRFQYPVNTATTNPDNYQKVVNRLKNNYGGDDDMKAPVWWSKNGIERYR